MLQCTKRTLIIVSRFCESRSVAVRCVAIRYIMLQCIAGSVRGVFRSLPVASMSADVLQRVAVSAAGRVLLAVCSVLQCVAVSCSVLQCVAACCSVLQCVAV